MPAKSKAISGTAAAGLEFAFDEVVLPVPTARVVDESAFRFLVELEVAKAQRLRYSVSVLCLTIDSFSESIDSNRIAEGFSDRVRATDIVFRTGSSWVFLLVDAEPDALLSIARRLVEPLGPVTWSGGGASYPGTAVDAEDLLRQAWRYYSHAGIGGWTPCLSLPNRFARETDSDVASPA